MDISFPIKVIGLQTHYTDGNFVLCVSAAGDEFSAPCTNEDWRRVAEKVGPGAMVSARLVIEVEDEL